MVHGFELTSTNIIVYYSLSGYDSNQLLAGESMWIRDDLGHASRLYRIIPMATLARIELGIMEFEPRRVGAKELYLSLGKEPGDISILETNIAIYTGSVDDYDTLSRVYYIARVDASEQAGYQISFRNWEYPSITQTPSIEATPTVGGEAEALPTSTAVIEIGRGISLRIEDTGSRQVHLLTMQLLFDGNAMAYMDGSPLPAPVPMIVLPTPESPVLAYPPPPTPPYP
jgi:hypothetical protein